MYLVAQRKRNITEVLAILGLLILVLCELIYLKDNMGDTYFRMNTVFKCYLPAWLMLGTAAFSMIGQRLSGWGKVPVLSARTTVVITAAVVCLLFALPVVVQYNAGYGSGTLDGLAYLSVTHPGDAGAVAYLRTLPGDERIVEAEDGDYTYYSRISSFTGIPTIIGQPFHEFMWRGDDDGWFSMRKADVKAIYEQPNETVLLMKRYYATLLYVGDSEHEQYNVSIPQNGLVKIYSADNTDIYRLAG